MCEVANKLLTLFSEVVDFVLRLVLQSNLSIADILYNGHVVIADTFLRNRINHRQTLIEKPLYSGGFYSEYLL